MKALHVILNDDDTYADTLISLDDTAAYLRCTRARISQLVAEGTLRKFPVGRRYYMIPKGDVDRYDQSERRVPARSRGGRVRAAR